MKDLLYIWYDECRTVLRDKGILIFIIFVPLAYPLLYSYVYTNEVCRDVPCAVVDDCGTALSRELVHHIDATPDAKTIGYFTNMKEAELQIKKHNAYGILHIPNSFEEDIRNGKQTNVGLLQLGDYWTLIAFIIPYLLACIFFAVTLSSLIYRREDCIMIFVFMSVIMVFMSGISWPASNIPLFWKVISWIFPSTLGMNAYIHIESMGCSLSDIHDLYMGIWIQVLVYFGTACIVYIRNINKMLLK